MMPFPSLRKTGGGRDLTKGFTVLEMITVLAILGLLIPTTYSAVGAYRERARLVQCISNLRGLGAALQIYSAENFGRLPEATPLNCQLRPDGTQGAMDLRLELFSYDPSIWSLTCPKDPRRFSRRDFNNPTYISYIYLLEGGGDLFKLKPDKIVIQEGGYFHSKGKLLRGTAFFADGHSDIQSLPLPY